MEVNEKGRASSDPPRSAIQVPDWYRIDALLKAIRSALGLSSQNGRCGWREWVWSLLTPTVELDRNCLDAASRLINEIEEKLRSARPGETAGADLIEAGARLRESLQPAPNQAAAEWFKLFRTDCAEAELAALVDQLLPQLARVVSAARDRAGSSGNGHKGHKVSAPQHVATSGTSADSWAAAASAYHAQLLNAIAHFRVVVRGEAEPAASWLASACDECSPLPRPTSNNEHALQELYKAHAHLIATIVERLSVVCQLVNTLPLLHALRFESAFDVGPIREIPWEGRDKFAPLVPHLRALTDKVVFIRLHMPELALVDSLNRDKQESEVSLLTVSKLTRALLLSPERRQELASLLPFLAKLHNAVTPNAPRAEWTTEDLRQMQRLLAYETRTSGGAQQIGPQISGDVAFVIHSLREKLEEHHNIQFTDRLIPRTEEKYDDHTGFLCLVVTEGVQWNSLRSYGAATLYVGRSPSPTDDRCLKQLGAYLPPVHNKRSFLFFVRGGLIGTPEHHVRCLELLAAIQAADNRFAMRGGGEWESWLQFLARFVNQEWRSHFVSHGQDGDLLVIGPGPRAPTQRGTITWQWSEASHGEVCQFRRPIEVGECKTDWVLVRSRGRLPALLSNDGYPQLRDLADMIDPTEDLHTPGAVNRSKLGLALLRTMNRDAVRSTADLGQIDDVCRALNSELVPRPDRALPSGADGKWQYQFNPSRSAGTCVTVQQYSLRLKESTEYIRDESGRPTLPAAVISKGTEPVLISEVRRLIQQSNLPNRELFLQLVEQAAEDYNPLQHTSVKALFGLVRLSVQVLNEAARTDPLAASAAAATLATTVRGNTDISKAALILPSRSMPHSLSDMEADLRTLGGQLRGSDVLEREPERVYHDDVPVGEVIRFKNFCAVIMEDGRPHVTEPLRYVSSLGYRSLQLDLAESAHQLLERFKLCTWVSSHAAATAVERLRIISTRVSQERKRSESGPANIESDGKIAEILPQLDALSDYLWINGTTEEREVTRQLRVRFVDYLLSTGRGSVECAQPELVQDVPDHAKVLLIACEQEGNIDVVSRAVKVHDLALSAPLCIVQGITGVNPVEWHAVQQLYGELCKVFGHSWEKLWQFLCARNEYVQNRSTQRLMRIVCEAERLCDIDSCMDQPQALREGIARIEELLLAAGIQRVYLQRGFEIPAELQKFYMTRRGAGGELRPNAVIRVSVPAFKSSTGALVGTPGTVLIA